MIEIVLIDSPHAAYCNASTIHHNNACIYMVTVRVTIRRVLESKDLRQRFSIDRFCANFRRNTCTELPGKKMDANALDSEVFYVVDLTVMNI